MMRLEEDFKMNIFNIVRRMLVVVLGLAVPLWAVNLTPATFQEYSGISGFTTNGVSSSIAESVQLTVTLEQTSDRGYGTVSAMTDSMLPAITGGSMNLSGGPSISGVGGGFSTETRYQFAVVPLEQGLPASVPIIFTCRGHASVDTSLSDPGTIGQTYARINYPAGTGGFSAQNYDAYGAYEGYFSFDQTVTGNVTVNTAKTIILWTYSHGQGAGESFFYNSETYAYLNMVIDPNFEHREQYTIEYSQGIVTEHADINRDGIVNVLDFSILAGQWLLAGEGLIADINVLDGDGIVDLEDLQMMADKWLNMEPWYEQP